MQAIPKSVPVQELPDDHLQLGILVPDGGHHSGTSLLVYHINQRFLSTIYYH
jgi:hypothetical protein